MRHSLEETAGLLVTVQVSPLQDICRWQNAAEASAAGDMSCVVQKIGVQEHGMTGDIRQLPPS